MHEAAADPHRVPPPPPPPNPPPPGGGGGGGGFQRGSASGGGGRSIVGPYRTSMDSAAIDAHPPNAAEIADLEAPALRLWTVFLIYKGEREQSYQRIVVFGGADIPAQLYSLTPIYGNKRLLPRFIRTRARKCAVDTVGSVNATIYVHDQWGYSIPITILQGSIYCTE